MEKISYITGERIAMMSDLVFYTRHPRWKPIESCYTKDILYFEDFIDNNNNKKLETKIQNKRIFCMIIELADFFIEYIMPHIKEPFIFITHFSDYPASFVTKRQQLLLNPLLIQWWGQNMDLLLIEKKVRGIPIGLENSFSGRVLDFRIFDECRQKEKQKDAAVYINFNPATNPQKRLNIFRHLQQQQQQQLHTQKPFQEYIQELSSHKYCICPEGNGVDCHRLWECIYLDVVPIVEESVIMSQFKDDELPILFLPNLEEFFLQTPPNIVQQLLDELYIQQNIDAKRSKMKDVVNLTPADLRFWIHLSSTLLE